MKGYADSMHTPAEHSQIGPVKVGPGRRHLAARIENRCGVNIDACWHCSSCANGCPFVSAMDYTPNAVIRLAQLGLEREALQSSGIWICVGCNTCAIQCPNGIDIPAVNDTLRQMAIESGAAVAEPDILAFHLEVLHSIERYGRTHKLEIMMRYKLRRRDWFADTLVGLKMLFRRKLDVLPSKSTAAAEFRSILSRTESRSAHADFK